MRSSGVRPAPRHQRPLAATAMGLFLLGLAGCAGGAGSVRPMGEPTPVAGLATYRSVHVTVRATEGVALTEADLARIAAQIAERTRSLAPGRFASITTGVGSPPAAGAETGRAADELAADLLITRYDPGSAAARFFMAGLGQAHVDGRLDLADRAGERSLGSHTVTKTFAWGGIYGAATGIQDVEKGFAEAVAEVLTGRSGS